LGGGEFVFQAGGAFTGQVHEGFMRGHAGEQGNELLGRGELFVEPHGFDFGEGVVYAEAVEVDGAVEVEIATLGLGDLFEAVPELLGGEVEGIVEDGFGFFAGGGLVAEGFFASVGDFQAGFEVVFEVVEFGGHVEEGVGFGLGEFGLEGFVVGGFFVFQGAVFGDFDGAEGGDAVGEGFGEGEFFLRGQAGDGEKEEKEWFLRRTPRVPWQMATARAS